MSGSGALSCGLLFGSELGLSLSLSLFLQSDEEVLTVRARVTPT